MKKNIEKPKPALRKSHIESKLSAFDITLQKDLKYEPMLKEIFFESAINAYITVDNKSIISYINPAFLKTWGYNSRKQVVGKSFTSFLKNEHDLKLVTEGIKKTGIWEGEFIAKKKDGTEFISESFGTAIRNHKGENIGFHLSSLDVSANLETEDSLHKSEERLRKVFDQSPIGMAFVDESLKYLDVNPFYCKMMGYSRKELLSLSVQDITHPDFIEKDIREAKRLKNKEIPVFKTEKIYIKKNKDMLWGNVTVTEVRDEEGNFLHYLSMIEDITERKRGEVALKSSENKYRRLHESIMDGFVIVDLKGNILEYNDAYRNMLGYKPEELAHLTYKDLTPEKWHDFEKKIVNEQILVKGFSEVYEKEYRRKDGTIFPVELRTFLIKADNGSNRAMWAIVRDITQRKSALEQVEKEKNIARNYLNIAEVMFLVLDENMKVTLINKKGCEILGYTEKEIIGKNWFDNFVPEKDRERTKEGFKKLMSGQIEEIEYSGNTVLTKSRYERIIEWHNTYLKNDKGKINGTLSSGLDITDRVKAEKAKQDFENKFKTLYESMNDGFVYVDMKGKILEFNETYRKMLGYDNEELKKLSYQDVTPEKWHDYENNITRGQVMTRGYSDFYKKEYIKKDGTIFPVELHTFLVRDENGNNEGFWGIVRDLSERKTEL